MKKQFNLIAVVSLLFTLSISAQMTISPSGNVVTQTYELEEFDALDISTDFNAIVTREDEISVRIDCDDNLLEHLIVEAKAGVLYIRHEQGLRIQGKETLVAHITMPNLTKVKGSEDAIIKLANKFETQNMTIDLAGDSVLDGELAVGNLHVKLRGDSYLTVWGFADKVNAKLRGDSEIKNYDFVINDLNLDLEGDSIAELTVENSMNVELDGDSEMRYKGNAKVLRKIIRGDSDFHRL